MHILPVFQAHSSCHPWEDKQGETATMWREMCAVGCDTDRTGRTSALFLTVARGQAPKTPIIKLYHLLGGERQIISLPTPMHTEPYIYVYFFLQQTVGTSFL